MNAPAKGFERVTTESLAFLGTDTVPASACYDADGCERLP
jgi:hypothetical protein